MEYIIELIRAANKREQRIILAFVLKLLHKPPKKRVKEKLTDWSAFFLPFEQVSGKLLECFPAVFIQPGQCPNEPMLKIVGIFRQDIPDECCDLLIAAHLDEHFALAGSEPLLVHAELAADIRNGAVTGDNISNFIIGYCISFQPDFVRE